MWNNYDTWKLSNNEKTCTCDNCERPIQDEKELNETSCGHYYCEYCADTFEMCNCCNVLITSSEYCHTELCDNCVDIKTDAIESNKGETY